MPETKQCPFCAESINKNAIKCKHCGKRLDAEANSVNTASSDNTVRRLPYIKALPMAVLSSVTIFGAGFALCLTGIGAIAGIPMLV
ncbi:MAG: hypothetical protein AAB489_01850 [Patescibacteria group bacterium]